jgi:hypothetical protein
VGLEIPPQTSDNFFAEFALTGIEIKEIGKILPTAISDNLNTFAN